MMIYILPLSHRSPGGTPIRQAPKPCMTNDPAALIAQALKKKFAKQRAEDSPDKENVKHFTPSPKKRTPAKESPKVSCNCTGCPPKMCLNISKGTSCRQTGFLSYGYAKSKYSPKVDFEISHILESSIFKFLGYLKDLVLQKLFFYLKMNL